MKKFICSVVAVALVVVCMGSFSSKAVHTHSYDTHERQGTYFQQQAGTHSHVYAYTPKGDAVYRPCILIEKRENCKRKCSCGDYINCSHQVQVYHNWAY